MFIDCFTSKKGGGRLLGSARLLGTIRYMHFCFHNIFPNKMVSFCDFCLVTFSVVLLYYTIY